jgi:hypothetical protein
MSLLNTYPFFSNGYPYSVSTNSAPDHRPPTAFNFPPQFPEESLERYPCLTRALADSYPGPRNFSTTSSLASCPYPAVSNQEPSGEDFYRALSTTSPYDWTNLNSIPILSQDRDVQNPQGPSRNQHPDSTTPHANSSLKQKEKPTSHSCCICGQFFRRLGALAAHLKRHQEPSDPIHKCEICGQPFVRPTALQKHLKRHQEEGFCRKPRPRHKCNVATRSSFDPVRSKRT